MGRGNNVVVLSSDEDESYYLSGSSSRSGSKSKYTSSGRSRNPRAVKRTRLSSSTSRSTKVYSNVDKIKLSFEDFDDCLNGFEVSAGGRSSKSKDLWVDKYKPCSLEELAVNKKKVVEVKTWLEDRLRTPMSGIRNHVLVVAGQAGVGKSATIDVIASQLGAKLCEWSAPTPTIWLEHKHNSSSGLQYTSKLDEFENFVERTRKYGLISSSDSREPKSPTVLVIDDLPVTNGRLSFQRLQNCMLLLVRSTQIPTIVLITDYSRADSVDQTGRCSEELQLSLENAGACKVTFNPITNNSIKKVLFRICRQERCNVSPEEIDLIASASGGDIRHAITSLQVLSLKVERHYQKVKSSSTYSKEQDTKLKAFYTGSSLNFGRDETLSLFHGLGKFLHNKRETELATESGCSEILVQEKFLRLPLKMDAPEKVLSQAHGQGRPISDFLHENVLDFIGEEAIDDAWTVSSYLADADLLLASFHGVLARHHEAENVLQSAAASVAVRGVLYGNFHPSPSRWHTIRKPKLWQVEQSSTRNMMEMTRQKSSYYNLSSVPKVSIIATEYTHVSKWLEFGATRGHKVSQIWKSDSDTNNENRSQSLEQEESELSDDITDDW